MFAARLQAIAFRVVLPSLSRQTIRHASRATSGPSPSQAVPLPHRFGLRPPPSGSPKVFRRTYAAGPDPPDFLSEGELHVFNKLKSELQPEKLEVQDISGGCGSMYGVDIVSARFTGLSVIKQHKLVNEVLKDEIKGWHGVQLKTKAP